ncbi:FkbM family methyltransferase [Microvirga sp. TS319]
MKLKAVSRRAAKLGQLLAHPTYRSGLIHKVAAAVEHEGALRHLSIASLIDVGANCGQFSLLAQALFPDLIIHAFEPLQQPASTYRRIFQQNPNIQLHHCALGESAELVDFHVSSRADSSSLLPITDKQEEIFPGTTEAAIEKVQVVQGDQILKGLSLPAPLMVKLDIQGYELFALKGLTNTLKTTAYIYSEVSFIELYKGQPLARDIIAWLASQGFYLDGIYNLVTTDKGLSVQADALFSNRQFIL